MENKNLNSSMSRKEKFQFAHKDVQLHDTKFETRPVGYIEDCMRRFIKNKASVVGGIIIFLIALFAIIVPIVDPKNYVDPLQYPIGFEDSKFATVLPKLFDEGGFWDGTEVRTISETDYEQNMVTDSNHEKIELIEKIEEKTFKGTTVKYVVRWDTYAVGCKIVTLRASEYEALIQYEKDNHIYQTEDSIVKPIVNFSRETGYLKELSDEILNEYVTVHAMELQKAEGLVNTIIDNMSNFYTSNSNIFFKLKPTKASSGLYNDGQFRPVLDNNGNVVEIYARDAEGNLVYSDINNADYNVRVDYYDYFTYKNGFEIKYIFGANQQGQDIFLRLAKGCRFSLLLGVGITIINFIIGLIWGAIAGYYGGTIDLLMERFTDVIANVPSIIIMTITQIGLTSNNDIQMSPFLKITIAILIAFIYNGWVGVASTTRMQFYRFKGQEYVLASRTLGAKDRRLIFKHILPNAVGTLVTSCVLMVPGVIFSESSLSYLGIIDFTSSGINSIGALLAEGQKAGLATYPHVLLFPALVISLLMISFNLFGNGLRDAFNTTLRGSED